MLNYTLRRREEVYQNFNNFTTKVNREILNVVFTLGWSMETMKTDNDNSLTCSYDSSHRISKRSLDRHLESCQWRKEGYNEYSVPLPESCLSLSSRSSIKLDASLQNSILQIAKKKDSTMEIENNECPTLHKFCISFFVSFVKYLNNAKYLLYITSFNFHFKCTVSFKT